MMKKMMKLWMHLILFAAFISAYANPVDCDFEKDSCNWSIGGFRRISGNEFNSTDGCNDKMHRNEVNYAVTEFKSTREQSVLTSGFDIYPGEKCLSFKYQMKDFKRTCIFIEVYTSDSLSWSKVWSSQSQHQFDGWNEINVTINVRNKCKITISFLHGNCSDVTYYISSISLKKQSCTESTTTFRTSPSTAIPMNSSRETMTPKITTKRRINTIVKLSSNDIATTTAAMSVNTSSHDANDGVIIGIVIGGLAFTVAVLLIATYLYRRKKQSNSGTNISMNNTGLYETLNVVFSQDNYEQISRVTSGRENNMMDRVYNNEEPEYIQIEE